MLKTIIYFVIAIAIAAFAAMQFCGQLEAVSATRARRDDKSRRSLELGKMGRIIVTVMFAVVFLIIMAFSHLGIMGTIVALIASVVMLIANVYLKANGFGMLPTLFLLWVGNIISSFFGTQMMTTDVWGKIYIVLQFVLLVLMAIVSMLGNLSAIRRKKRVRREEFEEYEDEAEDEADEGEDEDSEEDEEDEDSDEEDDFDEDEEEYFDDDEPNELDESYEKAEELVVKVLGIAVIVIVFVALGYFLEWKFDFFPPYRL